MSDNKEFQGKSLDDAIEAACRHYDLKRDKLEIEIVSGGSSGIFGLVGVKPAVVRAKPRGSFKLADEAEERKGHRAAEDAPAQEKRAERKHERHAEPKPEPRPERKPAPVEAAAPAALSGAEDGAPVGDEGQDQDRPADRPADRADDRGEEGGEGRSRRERGRRGRGRSRGEGRGEQSGESQPAQAAGARSEARADGREGREPREGRGRSRGRGRGRDNPARENGGRDRGGEQRLREPRREETAGFGEEEEGGAPQGIGHLDQALLEQVALEVTAKILAPLSEEAKITIQLMSDRVLVRIDDPENSGLLIGREGQTLASIQYLVNRLVSKRMDASVRVQIDTGDYRENQDEKLRQIARHLADKATASGRTQSTRPMSSYHRRVVHLTLQEDEFVFTRSKGEGAMKRVLIVPKRPEAEGSEAVEEAAEE